MYLFFGLNRVIHAFEPTSITSFFIPNKSFFLVKISITFSVLYNEFKAPKTDSKPVAPKREFLKSVFLLSMSIGQ